MFLVAGGFGAFFEQGRGGREGTSGFILEQTSLRLLLSASGGVGDQGGGMSECALVSYEAVLQWEGELVNYLTAQQASLEALGVLATLWSEERVIACVIVREGFMVAC